MKAFSSKLFIGAALSAALVGCGGGGDDGGDPGTGGPSIPLVDGSMVSVNQSGKNFQSNLVFGESMASSNCEASTAYFESANVMAYSAASHTEAELQKVASTVEYSLNGLASKFGYSGIDELMSVRKRAVSPLVIENFASSLSGLQDESFNRITMDQLSPYLAANVPEGYTGWDDPLIDSVREPILVRSVLVSAPNGAEVALVLDEMITNAEALSGQSFSLLREELANKMIHDKVQVCVLPDSMKGAAEGHTIGFNIAATEQYSFYVHEGTHFIQKQYAERFPRWMTEGQAVYFAGQELATSKSSVNIMEILSFNDEGTYGQDFYEHYGLAYKALHVNNTLDEVMSFLQAFDRQESWIVDYNQPGTDAYQLVKKAFEDTLTDWNGQSITYEEFSNSYDTLAK